MTGISIPKTTDPQEPKLQGQGSQVAGIDPGAQDPQKTQQADSEATLKKQLADDLMRSQEALAADARNPVLQEEDVAERVQRLMASYANAWKQPLIDDRGNVLREGSDSDLDAFDAAMDFFERYSATDAGPRLLREYIKGGDLPRNFIPPTGSIESTETFLERKNAEARVKLGREQHPALWAVYDYFLDPVGSIIPNAIQVGSDLVVGGLNIGRSVAGAEGQIDPIDAKAKLFGLGQGILGDASSVRAQIDAAAASSSEVAQGLQVASEFGGMAMGFGAGAIGKALGVAGKAGGAVGTAFGGKLLGNAGRQIGHSAGVFGAYEGIVAPEGERLEGFFKGAGTGFAMGAAHATVGAGLRRMMGMSQKQLSAGENKLMESVKNWAIENKLFRERFESGPAHSRRVVDSYIGAGMPLAPKNMPVRKLVGHAAKSGSDGLGFSMIDPQFREDLVDAWASGDPEKWTAVAVKLGGNFLGAAAMRTVMSNVVPLQRKNRIEPTGKEPKPEPPPPEPMVDVQRVDPRDFKTKTEKVSPEDAPKQPTAESNQWTYTGDQRVDSRTLQPKSAEVFDIDPTTGVRMDARRYGPDVGNAPKQEWNPWAYRGDQKVDPRTLKPKGAEVSVPDEVRPNRADIDAATGVNMEARRYGWDVEVTEVKPSKKGKVKKSADQKIDPKTLKPEIEKAQRDPSTGAMMEPTRRVNYRIEGTDHSFRVEGDMAFPSDALRKTLGLPESMPAKDLTRITIDAVRLSNLRADTVLPGEKVDVRTSTHATPSVGDKPGVLYRAVLGELQESPITFPQEWKPVEKPPEARKSEALGIEQETVVKTLKGILNSDAHLDSATREILRGVTGKLDKVSARSDRSVAETMEAMPEFMKALEEGVPPADVVRAMADSLTGKTPEMALRDMDKAVRREVIEAKLREKDASEELKPPKSKRSQRQTVEEIERAIDELSGEGERSSEAGFVDLSTAIEASKGFAMSLGSVPARVLDSFQRDQMQRLEDLGVRDVAEIGREGSRATHELRARHAVAGLMDLARTKRSDLDSSQDLVADGIGGYAPRFAIARDAGLESHFGKVSLTAREAEIAAKHQSVTYEAAKIAEEQGAQSTNVKGEDPRPVVARPDTRAFVRDFTPETLREMREGKGERYDGIVAWLQKKYDWSPEEVKREFSNYQSATALDSIEIRRSIAVMPTHVDTALGPATPIMETRPYEHARSIAERSAYIMGARSVMPREIEIKGDKRFTEDSALEPLPETALKLVTKVLNEHGDTSARAAHRMIRAMHGLSLDAPDRGMLGWMPRPGEKGHRAWQILGSLAGTAKASALTMAWVRNIVEPWGNTPIFGARAIANAYNKVNAALTSGEFAEMHRQNVAEAWVTDTKINDPIKGDTKLETVNNLIRKATDIIYSPMRWTQDYTEMVNVEAAKIRLSAMQAGDGIRSDASALRQLGFQKPEIDAMLRGEGTSEQYASYRTSIGGRVAGGKSLLSAEKSDLAHNRTFNSLVWFTNYAQTRTRLFANAIRDFQTAPTPAERVDALRAIVGLGTMTIVQGAAGTLLLRFMGGVEPVLDEIREFAEDDVEGKFWKTLEMLSDGTLGATGQPIAAAGKAFSEPGVEPIEAWGAAAAKAIGPMNAGFEVVKFIGAIAFDQEWSGYENKNWLGKAGVYLRKVMPAAKRIHEGVFGISALAITEKNPDLDRALDSYYRWLSENRPHDLARSGKDPAIAHRQWRDSMKKLMDLVMSDRTFNDQELVDALVDAEAAGMAKVPNQTPSDAYKAARQAVASSLRIRKVLPDPKGNEMTEAEIDSLTRHLGDKHVETLRDYDAVLDMMSQRVQRIDLRRQVFNR